MTRGKRVFIFDSPKPNRATSVAAGSINPVSFKRVILSWRASSMMNSAERFYSALEEKYRESFLRTIPAQRVHASEEEAQLWVKRELEEPIGKYIKPSTTNENIIAPNGSGVIPKCLWLNTQRLLELHESRWDKSGLMNRASVDEISYSSDGLVQVNDKTGRTVIHCTGAFHALPGLVPVQGEVLTLHIPELSLTESIHRGCFLIPLGNDMYRLGSTFEWNDVWSGPTDKARAELIDKLSILINRPVTIVDHWAGTRPTTKDRRPLIGSLRDQPGQYVLNGLGSKGAMIAPWCAQHLSDHLIRGKSLDPEVDIARYYSH